VYVAVRLAVILFLPITQFSDSLWYYARGVGLAAGQGYFEGGLPTAFWPPGWPGLLGLLFWLFGPSQWVGQIANVIFAAITFFLTLQLGATFFADKLVGRAAVMVLTIYPNQIGYVPTLATEVFYTALLLLAVFIAIHERLPGRFVLCGLIFGIATLTKAQTLYIPLLLFAVWQLLSKERMGLRSWLTRVALVYAAMAVVILPWTARNYSVFGEFVLISTNGGGTLLTGNNPSAWGDYTENDALVKQVPNDVAGQVANDRLATALALQWIRDNPAAFAILIPRKIWRLWAPDGESEWSFQAGYKNYDDNWMAFRAVRTINQAYYVCLIGSFALSVFYYAKRRHDMSPYAVTGYVLAAYFTAISIVFSGQSRFHFPLMPWIAMYAAWALAQWAGRREPPRPDRRPNSPA
jgi:4-amino-4-deoxy-L-arabinose transferase-like glycosyltransferase